jgi:hypothetical protein
MRITLSDGVPEACMAILGPQRRTRDGETEGTDLLAIPPRRGEVRDLCVISVLATLENGLVDLYLKAVAHGGGPGGG